MIRILLILILLKMKKINEFLFLFQNNLLLFISFISCINYQKFNYFNLYFFYFNKIIIFIKLFFL